MTERARCLVPIVTLAFAGVIQALCFAPGPLPAWLLSPLQLLCMAVLVRSVWLSPSPRMAALRAWVFSMASCSVGLYWLTISMHVYGYMPLPLAIAALLALSAYLALFGALAGSLIARIGGNHRTGAAFPLPALTVPLLWAAAWTLAEWLRATVLTGFPWLATAYAHTDSWLAGWTPVVGAYGVTFFAAFTAAALARVTTYPTTPRPASKRWTHPASGLAVTLGVFVVGFTFTLANWSTSRGQPTIVRLVQGNIDQGTKFSPEQLTATLRKQYALAAQPPAPGKPEPALVVLPETAIVLFQHQLDPAVWHAWQALAQRQGSTIIMGAPLVDLNANRYTNSVIAIDGKTSIDALIAGNPQQRYDKHHLVPFGEFVPFGFRWFVDLMSIPLGDFGRGDMVQAPFRVRDQFIAPNICYEDIFGEELLVALRESTPGQPGASILVNVSNLGWFGDSWALRQHWQMARMRAMETSRPMLRATNTGITGAIGPNGKPLGQLAAHVAGVVDVSVQGQSGLTPYARTGNVPLLLLCIALLGCAWAWSKRKS